MLRLRASSRSRRSARRSLYFALRRGNADGSLYDAVSTAYYPELSKKMAMKIGGEYESDKVVPKHFEQMAEEAGLARPMVKRRGVEIAESVLSKAPDLVVESPCTEPVAALVQSRSRNAIQKSNCLGRPFESRAVGCACPRGTLGKGWESVTHCVYSDAGNMTQYRSRAIWVAALGLLADSSALACSCASPRSTAEALAAADAVFSGTVIDIGRVEIEDAPFTFSMNRVTLRVIDTWKGPNSDTKVLLTGLGGGDCGFPFTMGTDYLIYAYNASLPGTFVTTICTRNTLLSSAAGDCAFLGQGQKPDRPQLNALRDQGTTTFTWLTNWTGFRVETTESLEAPLPWRPLSNYVGSLGHYHVVTNSATTSSRSLDDPPAIDQMGIDFLTRLLFGCSEARQLVQIGRINEICLCVSDLNSTQSPLETQLETRQPANSQFPQPTAKLRALQPRPPVNLKCPFLRPDCP